MVPDPSTDGVSRRALLAGTATGLAVATSGCARQARSIAGRDAPDQLSITISTLVDDYDREAVRIARTLAEALEAVGIDVSVDTLSHVELHRRVLLNHDFDVYVGRHPADPDPDFLYETLHSVYADEAGWQNPFGFTSMSLDDLLERQRKSEDEDRREVIGEILKRIAQEQPFTPLCIPEEVRLVRTDRFDGWGRNHPSTRLGYLGLEPLADDVRELQAVITDTRPTQNLNPLSAEYRGRATVVSLLYDSLLASDGEDVRPWLAESVDRDGWTLEVTLRDDLRWHDGERLTAADVAFTYRLLEDTSLGEQAAQSPAPQYRGLTTVFDSIDVSGDRELTFETACGPDVTARALTVPILPEHVWADRTGEAEFPSIDDTRGTTDAVVAENVPPVGSGPFAFEDRTDRDVLVLERFEDHFTLGDGVDLPEPTVETLRLVVEPRSTAAIERIERGEGDATVSTLQAYSIDEVSESNGVRLLESPSWTFYHIGFNARNAPFSNPYVRRTVARLLDKNWIASEIFEGHATPVATPIADEWAPDGLAWNGVDPEVPFFGISGELEVEAARTAFEEIGFAYDEEGRLLARN